MTSGNLMTYEQAAERLGVHPHWLRRRVKDKTIPHIYLGKLVRFSEEHLAQIIAAGENTVQPIAPALPEPLSVRARRQR